MAKIDIQKAVTDARNKKKTKKVNATFIKGEEVATEELSSTTKFPGEPAPNSDSP